MTVATSPLKHPKELWILALTELCERFAFWGVGNLLVLFLIEYYQIAHDKASEIYGVFTGFAAFLPLLGGWIADRWNYQSPMFLGAVMNAIGCFMLASGIHALLYPALFTICCGYGIFTPSILTVLGHTYQNKPNLREAGFSIYYASINVGVFLALASLGSIANYLSWQIAFGVAGAVQLAGLIPLILYMIQHKETIRSLKDAQSLRREKNPPFTFVEKQRLKVIGVFCLISILFWMAYNQGFSSMEIFVHDFMNKQVAGHLIPEGLFLSSESFFLILLAPALAVVYGRLQKKHKDPSPAMKTALSLFAMALCFLIMVIGSKEIPSDATSANISSWYIVSSYFLMAVGEMLLAPIGLSMVSRLSPRRYTALMIGLWYVCVGIAFFSGGMIASLMEKVGGLFHFFTIFVLSTLIPGIILLFFTKKLTKMSHLNEPIEMSPFDPSH